jgi:hypothetical protein
MSRWEYVAATLAVVLTLVAYGQIVWEVAHA